MSEAERMRAGTWRFAATIFLAGFAALWGAGPWGLAGAQMQTHPTGGVPPASAGGASPAGPAAGMDASPFPDTSRQKRNDERQRRLVMDTDRLLALTALLKSEVATTGAETMSPEMLKQMSDIEKLAKSVKDKMRN